MFDDMITGMMTLESINSSGLQVARFISLFAVMLIPTFLIGGTLPIMSRFYIKNIDGIGLGIGSLYAANTYGAMAGCFATGYLLISQLGVWGTLITAFWLNLTAAGLAWVAPGEAEPAKQKVTSKGRKGKKKRETEPIEENSGRGEVCPEDLCWIRAVAGSFIRVYRAGLRGFMDTCLYRIIQINGIPV